MTEQQQPIVKILETDMPGTNGTSYGEPVERALDDGQEVKPVHLHAPESGVIPRTVEQERAYYQAAEPDILAGLFEAVDEAAVAVVAVAIPRITFPMLHLDGSPVLEGGTPVRETMRLRFLRQFDADIEQAIRRSTQWIPNPDVPGGPRVERTNQAKMRAWVIYNATVPEDKSRFWDNTEIVKRLRVGNGVEVVDKLLTAGEKLQCVNAIYGHSGLMTQESEVEQVAKP